MASQLAYGFMPMDQALGYNWEQSRPAMGPIEALSGMPDLYRQAAQQQYSHQPMADSFLRRFGQPMLDAPQQQAMPQPDILQQLMAQGGMIDAMTNQGAQDAGTSFMQNARGGEGLAQYSGKLADQPWLDEYVQASRMGVDTPVLQGNAGPQSAEMKAGIAQRRQQRLAENAPALSLADRKKNVMNQAMAKSEQRAVRMGDMSPNEQFFNEVERFQPPGGNQDFLYGMLFGPEAMVGMAALQDKAAARQWAASPEGMAAALAGSGVAQAPSADPAEAIFQRSAGDWGKFKVMANAMGMSAQQTLDAWARMTGQQMGGARQPGFLEGLFGNSPSYQHEQGQPYPIPYG